MARKGNNTIVLDCKESIIRVANDCIEQGLPISMVEVLFENVLNTLKENVRNVLEQENKIYTEELMREQMSAPEDDIQGAVEVE